MIPYHSNKENKRREKAKIKHEKIVTKISNLFNDEYSVLGFYISGDKPLLIKHNKCNHVWGIYTSNFLQGRSKCPKCSGKLKYTKETFQEKVNDLSDNEYLVLGEYTNTHTKILMKHKICGHEWSVKPKSFITDHSRCPRCSRKERYTNERFKEVLEQSTDGRYQPLETYVNNRIEIKFLHTICGNTFYTAPTNIINSMNVEPCPFCKASMSSGEIRIRDYLNRMNILFEQEYSFPDCKHIRALSFDFAIKDKEGNVIKIIEFDGKQHFEPIDFFGGEDSFLKGRQRDEIKNKYCEELNIPLLRIPYWDFKNIDEILDKHL